MSADALEFGLPRSVVDSLRAVLARHPAVREAVVYGSRATGTARRESDIDLTLDGEGLSMRDLLRVESEFDDLLIPWRVDLSLRSQIGDPAVLAHIARIGRPLYRADDACKGAGPVA